MSEGMMLEPGAGRLIEGGGLHATLKVSGGAGAVASTFEVIVPPGFDVGAHVHSRGEELFYVAEGELDLLAFEPLERTPDDWHTWRGRDGRRFLRGGAGSVLFVPAGVPHAFSNPSGRPARMLFQSAPSGHEDYFDELTAMLRAAGGNPDPEAMRALRARHDIEQLTRFAGGH